jgi:hypothetical protein
MRGNASSNEFSRKSLGKLPEKHTYVWHLVLSQQSVRHDRRNWQLRQTFKNFVIGRVVDGQVGGGPSKYQTSGLDFRHRDLVLLNLLIKRAPRDAKALCGFLNPPSLLL